MKFRKVIKYILIIMITIISLFSMNVLLTMEQEESKKSNITQADMSYSSEVNYNQTSENQENENLVENKTDNEKEKQNEAKTVNEPNVENTKVAEYEKNSEAEEIQTKYTDGMIGTLKIPKLELEAEIKEGIDEETLASYIGHFTNSSLWDGNVALAAHNRGSTVEHYFEGIHLLEEGDEIIYITNMGERRYKVVNQKEISNTDWSVTLETAENTLTMITCITGYPEKRLCVQAKEV